MTRVDREAFKQPRLIRNAMMWVYRCQLGVERAEAALDKAQKALRKHEQRLVLAVEAEERRKVQAAQDAVKESSDKDLIKQVMG